MSTMLTQAVLYAALTDLREGRVQDADDRLTTHLCALDSAARAAADQPPAPPPKREQEAIVLDILRVVSANLGNPAILERLIEELIGTI